VMVFHNQNHHPAGWSCVAVSSCDAILSHVSVVSLPQASHSQTESHIHGEIVRRKIAGRTGRAVVEITGQCHHRNESREGAIHSPAAV